MNSKEFMHWFEQQVKTRWPRHDFNWIEIGDWHWRLRDDFNLDTLTEAVRRHKVCDDWRVPSLKKVYEYACRIRTRHNPKPKRTDHGIPEAHTYIMCTAKGDNGRGCVGHFVPILVWPFHKTYTAETYLRVATREAGKHADVYGGTWEVFTRTTRGEMIKRSNRLCGIKPLDLPAKP